MQYDSHVFFISGLEANEMLGKSISIKYTQKEFQEVDTLEEEVLKEFQGKFINFELFSNYDSVCSLTLSVKAGINSEFWMPHLTLSIDQVKSISIL